MIRVTVELVPKGVEALKKTLATMEIANDATGDADVGHYQGTLHGEYTGPEGRKGWVGEFHRQKQSVWSLVGAFLKLWGHTGHPQRLMSKNKPEIQNELEILADPKSERAD